MPGVGPLEIAIVLIIVLIIFGPKRLPGLGKSLGTGMREFKDSITGDSKHDDDDEQPRRLSDAPAPREASTAQDADQSVAADEDGRAPASSGSTRTDDPS